MQQNETPNSLFANVDKLHTTELGEQRIRKNLGHIVDGVDDVIAWCKEQARNPETISRVGKNWYVRGNGFVLTINAQSFTIITAKREKSKKGSDMNDVGLPRSLDDIPELKARLIEAFDTKTWRNVAKYSLLLANHILQLADIPKSDAINKCYEISERWQNGYATFQEARALAGEIHALARAESNLIREKALRCVAQVALVPHVKRHALIASDYAVKVVNLMHPNDMNEVRKEREAQIRLMGSV
ncbi:MAG: DUF3781 domain-containing protein [Bifidobacteriaceae bacterium]|jgi:hypothetical protein|nr:DUF3781 domain-containing protein [Bifidobacteriaceae bacterium]